MLRLTHLGMLAVAAASQPPAGVTDGGVPDRGGVARSATLRLTAKVTAKLHDTTGPQEMAMDAYIRPELRRCGGR